MQKSNWISKVKSNAKEIKRNVFVLYLAYRDPRVPWYAKLFTILVVAYAFSPIDLIPDFIPILGYIDDIVLVPLGIVLALKMIPAPVIEDCRARAEEISKSGKPKNWFVGGLFILIWILLAVWLGKIIYEWLV